VTETALALHAGIGSHDLPDPGTWSTMLEMAKVFLESGMLPAHVKTPAAAVLMMQKARELGIPPLYGLSNIAVVQGKPVCTAELMLALIYRDHGDGAVAVEHSDDESCAVRYRRRHARSSHLYAFTLEDAKRAGLLANQTWQKYPAAMLRARCISAVARMAFPDSIGGMYTPDELGARTVVDAEGAVAIAPDEDARTAPRALPRPPSREAGTLAPAANEVPKPEAPAHDDEPLTGEQLAEHFSPSTPSDGSDAAAPSEDAELAALTERYNRTRFDAEALGIRVPTDAPTNVPGLTRALESLEGQVRRARTAAPPGGGRRR
jgi:hypothetical protein